MLRLVLLCKFIGGSVVFDSEFVDVVPAVSGGGEGELGEPGRGEDGG